MSGLHAGEHYEITDLNSRGFGIVRVDGKVVFVKSGAIGDVCTLEKTGEEKNYTTAVPTGFFAYSKDRVESDCPLFGVCGGCSLRHVNEEAETMAKKKTVESAFRRFGIRAEICDTLSPSLYAYRNKVTFRPDGFGGVGFYETKTNDLVPLGGSGCRNVPDELTDAAKKLSRALFDARIVSTAITVRESTDRNVAAVFDVSAEPDGTALSYVAREIRGVCSLGVRVNGGQTRTVSGETTLHNSVFGLSLSVSFDSFFQVNYEGAELLFSKIAEYAGREPFSTCADLFCGTGVWGLALACRFPEAKFYGVDLNESAIADARKNARSNGLDNIKFYAGDAAMRTPEGAPDLVILDPPRAGCSPSMRKTLTELSPERIIYVSCNPFTLARDAAELASDGYEVREGVPVNMFPRTEHVETVVRLSRQ